MNQTVKHWWQTYRTRVVPPNASPVQVSETRRAFYAGAKIMMEIVRSIGGDEFDQAAGVAVLEALDKELDQFNEDVRNGNI